MATLFPLQSFHVHGELTPVVWDDERMKPEVRKQLLEIAKTFEESLGIPVKVKDIWLTGSTANYNWSKFSDIDLHLLLDFSEIDEDEEMVRELMLAKKSVFNEEHDIKIGPFDVELYAQDVHEPHEATGVYSVKNDKWLRRPKREKPELDLVAVKRKAGSMMKMIEQALAKDSCDSSCLDRAMDRIKKMRKTGLDKGGEYSVENLAFKVLRRNGYLEKLWTEQRKRLDRELSLPKKVAKTWLLQAAYSAEFLQWAGTQRFRHPETNNRVKFRSLPGEQQARIHEQWAQRRRRPAQQGPDPKLQAADTDDWSGGTIYRANPKDDVFVHFTPLSRAKQILESGKLLAKPPYEKFGIEGVQAVSLGYGSHVPEVQSTHIKTPNEDPLVAVRFRTSTEPKLGRPEEVIWPGDVDVELEGAEIISAEDARNSLEQTPSALGEDDVVYYDTAWKKHEEWKRKKGKKASLRFGKYNPEFLQWVGQQRFMQPETKNRVLFQSLPDDEQKKIYERWNQMTHGEDAERVKQENRWLMPNQDPKRYDHIKFEIRLDEETAEKDRERLQQMFDTEDQDEIRNAILDLAGVGGVASMVESVDVLTWQEGKYEAKVKIMGRGKDGIHFDRTLTYEDTGDEDQPYLPDKIDNQLFSVGRQAPPGIGTRMLASQVGAAEQAGFRIIEAEASRSDTMNGYYTWPRLGFNAELTQEDLDDLEEENPEAAWQVRQLAEADADRMWPDAPAELFHVMAIPEARKWWEREGHSVMAAFSVSDAYDGGKAYQLLRAYTEAKAMAEGKTIPEYLAKIAGKKGKNMPPRLTKQDNQILDRVWEQARKRLVANVKNKKKANELARFWIWTKIVKNTLPI